MLIPFALVPAVRRGGLRGALVVLAAGATGAAGARALAPPAGPLLVAVPTVIPLAAPASDDALEVPDLPDAPVRGAAASRHDDRLRVAWTGRDVFLSTDGGRYFFTVLAGADRGAVMDAAFDRGGRLHVLRGDGWLGVHDDDARPVEGWVRAGTVHDPDAAGGDPDTRPRLLVAGDAVAVIGGDPAAPTRLLMARGDRRGRWQVAPLFDDPAASWDLTEIWSIAPAATGRAHIVVHSWRAGECGGDDLFHEVDVDVGRGTARARRLEGYPP